MAKRAAPPIALSERTLDARPDTVDFRDRMFVPTLVEVPLELPLDEYRQREVPVLDQGREGACTGFGLATVVHYLLRTRQRSADQDRVSSRMLYEMAKRYDEWPGEEYAGSSARGAIKGWHKHGVCTDDRWPYRVGRPDRRLTDERARSARERPLGAYFRVNHKDVVAMHAALAEVKVLYATAIVHEGWNRLDSNGHIPYPGNRRGGHAFAIVAYNRDGFWLQNSWGPDWGAGGFALISYDDWLENGTDVWVARLGAPIDVKTQSATATVNWDGAGGNLAYTSHAIRSHVISLGNDGRLRDVGTYGTSEQEVELIFKEDFPRITKTWNKKRLLLYAHGGLTSESSAIQRVADYRQVLLSHEVYPLAFSWNSDFWTTLKNILSDAFRRRRAEGLLDSAKDFMLDRLDDALEPLARSLSGKAQWDEMKENARLATESAQGGIYRMCRHLARLLKQDKTIELHLAGHSAGAIVHAPLVQYLTSKGKINTGPMRRKTGLGLKVASCTLWAPACTVDLFKETYLPAIQKGGIERFTLFTLTDAAEREDHCANIYNKSLLYLVSNAFEHRPRIPFSFDASRRDGVPILGMQRFVQSDPELKKLFDGKAQWVLSPNAALPGSAGHATALRHGDFDDDPATLRATLARILRTKSAAGDVPMMRSGSSMRDQRRQLE